MGMLDELAKCVTHNKWNDDFDPVKGLAKELNIMKKRRASTWSVWAQQMSEALNWEAFYMAILEDRDLFDDEWSEVFLVHAEAKHGIERKYLMRMLGWKQDEEFKEVRNDDYNDEMEPKWKIENRTGPRQRHEPWNGGGLALWKKWRQDFEDLSIEFDYDNDVAIRRLKKYTSKAPESATSLS